jgi:hypothetical protein
MTDEQIEEAERILSYWEACEETARVREVVLTDSVAFLRDVLPDWSAFKSPEVTR